MNKRNEEIRTHYDTGHTIRECAEKFGMSAENARQILLKFGELRRTGPMKKRFVTIWASVSPETKRMIEKTAKEKGISIARLTGQLVEATSKHESGTGMKDEMKKAMNDAEKIEPKIIGWDHEGNQPKFIFAQYDPENFGAIIGVRDTGEIVKTT